MLQYGADTRMHIIWLRPAAIAADGRWKYEGGQEWLLIERMTNRALVKDPVNASQSGFYDRKLLTINAEVSSGKIHAGGLANVPPAEASRRMPFTLPLGTGRYLLDVP